MVFIGPAHPKSFRGAIEKHQNGPEPCADRPGKAWKGPGRPGKAWKDPERVGEARKDTERSGKGGKGPERPGEAWKGRKDRERSIA